MPFATRRFAAISLSFYVLILPVFSQQPQALPEFEPGQILLRFDTTIPDAEQKRLVEDLGLSVRFHYELLRGFWCDCPAGADVLKECEALTADPRIEFAHPNWHGVRVGSFNLTPNDPMFSNCYGLNNTGQVIGGQSGTVDADIDAAEAWCLRTDASNVIIAIVDSGVQLNHPDIAANLWVNPADPVNGIDDDGNGLIDDINGWDFNANDNVPEDTDGHGTTVTGVACAVGNNGLGISGVCWTSQTMILKDGNAVPSAAASALSLQYAAAHNVAVVNFSTSYAQTALGIGMFQTAVNVCQSAGVVICVSAGNSGQNVASTFLNLPMAWTNDNLFVVGATDNRDVYQGFSNFSTTSVDISAPGVGIYTTSNNGLYAPATGTSFSAPMTTGAVALVRAQNPGLTHQAIIAAFMANGDPIPAQASLTVSGMRLNLDATIQAIPLPLPQYQTNSFGSTMDIDGIQGTNQVAATTIVPIGNPFVLNLFSFGVGLPWDLGYALNPLVPRVNGALITTGNQIVNLDLADPSFGTWFDFTNNSPPFVNLAIPASISIASQVSLQAANIDPGIPDGVAFSQPFRLVVQ
ncbi:MAG: hypothetical protein CMJ83_11775 [Planctomycetes bacterium]|nr:hypothetical protein [Planctomycetota bacterium]